MQIILTKGPVFIFNRDIQNISLNVNFATRILLCVKIPTTFIEYLIPTRKLILSFFYLLPQKCTGIFAVVVCRKAYQYTYYLIGYSQLLFYSKQYTGKPFQS